MRETRNFGFAQIPIGDVVHDVKAWLARKADARQVTPGIDDGAAPRQILAERSALFILLKNLVDNAIDVSPDAAVVVIRCAADRPACDRPRARHPLGAARCKWRARRPGSPPGGLRCLRGYGKRYRKRLIFH